MLYKKTRKTPTLLVTNTEASNFGLTLLKQMVRHLALLTWSASETWRGAGRDVGQIRARSELDCVTPGGWLALGVGEVSHAAVASREEPSAAALVSTPSLAHLSHSSNRCTRLSTWSVPIASGRSIFTPSNTMSATRIKGACLRIFDTYFPIA